jgi:hypothetical protein
VLQLVVLTEVFLGVVVVNVPLTGPSVGAFGPVHLIFPNPHFVAVG